LFGAYRWFKRIITRKKILILEEIIIIIIITTLATDTKCSDLEAKTANLSFAKTSNVHRTTLEIYGLKKLFNFT